MTGAIIAVVYGRKVPVRGGYSARLLSLLLASVEYFIGSLWKLTTSRVWSL